MIVRIVKMVIDNEHKLDYENYINSVRSEIRAFEGCSYLEIWNGLNDKSVYFSYSYWESEAHLEEYRHSELFNRIWPTIKQWFAAKPEAWSVDKVFINP